MVIFVSIMESSILKERMPHGHFALLVANAIFGINQSLSKLVLNDSAITPLTLVSLRMMAGALLFWITSLFVKSEKVPLKDILILFLASFIGVQLNQYTFIIGLQYTTPIDTAVMATMGPIITMLAATIILKEPLSWKKVSGVMLGAIGAWMLIAGRTDSSLGSNPLLGNTLCLISASSYALYLVIFKDIICRYSAITVMKYMFLFASVVSMFICGRDVISVDYMALPVELLLELLVILFFCTYFAFMLLPIGQKYLRPTVVSMYMYVQPITSAILSIALGLDKFNTIKIIAASLVFTGVYIVTQSRTKEPVELK